MRPEQEQLIRGVYASWNEGDTSDLGRHFTDDFVYSTSGMFPDFDRVYEGPEGMLRFYEEMLSAWETFRIELRKIEPHGDGVLTSVRFFARGNASGVEVELDFFHGLRFEGGRIKLLAAGATAGVALEAAGLPS